MKMRMWLCTTGFASNWFNECVLLPLIEHMPRVPSSSPTRVVFVSSCSLHNFCSCITALSLSLSLCPAPSPVKVKLIFRQRKGRRGSAGGLLQLMELVTDLFVLLLSFQIGLWHSEDGLSMERTLPSINVTDTLFNTTLTITTILVRPAVCAHTRTHTH